MKKKYTGKDEPKKIWDEVYKRAEKGSERPAIGEKSGYGFVFYSYGRLISDAHGLALALSELTDPADPITVGASAFDTATVILAASLISRSVIISDLSDGMTFNGLIITDKNTFSPKFISPEELRTLIAGALSGSSSSPSPHGKEEIEITFRSNGGSVTYSESAAILSALAFKTGCGLRKGDRLMSLIHPSTESGLLSGLLAPLLCSATSAVCINAKSTVRYMRSISPTKLFCPREVASAIILKLLRIKKKHPRTHSSVPSLSIEPMLLWLCRLSHPRISYLLGGRLRTIISTDEISPLSARVFFSFGIYSITVRSVKGLTPTLFHYGEDPRGVWKLPVGSTADMCNVQKGGVGSLVIKAPHVRKGIPLPNTYLPGEMPDSSSLVTPLCGFVMKNGRVFVSGE